MKNVARLAGFALAVVIFAVACSKGDNKPASPALPACTTNSAPADGASVGAGTGVLLSWAAATGAASYDVYLGTAAVPSSTIATNVTGTSLSFTTGASNTTYYWYVVPKNASGNAASCAATRITSFHTSAAGSGAPPPFGFYVVGYFPNYRSVDDVPDVKFRMCNVVNYAFFSVNATGTLTVNNPALVPRVIQKAKTNGARVMVSINEAAQGNFRNMAATAPGRTVFIKDVLTKVRQYGFDGVDVDWEFPSTADGTHTTFTALMKELSDSLHWDAKYYLTAAITAGKYAGAFRDAIQSEVFAYVDFFNVMAYDDFSTGVPYKHHSDSALAATCLKYWLTDRGMPPAKCVLGFPAYGRPSGMTQSGTTLAYKEILSKGGSPLSDSAVVSTTAFPAGFTIYYNGQPTVKNKAILARQRANGVMMWEKWHDAIDGASLLKAACDTVGRAY